MWYKYVVADAIHTFLNLYNSMLLLALDETGRSFIRVLLETEQRQGVESVTVASSSLSSFQRVKRSIFNPFPFIFTDIFE